MSASGQIVISGVAINRAADFHARMITDSLGEIEKLAVAILRGGHVGEEAIPGLLDEAIATYSHGSYRVPVRVIANPERLLVVASLERRVPQTVIESIRGDILGVVAKGLAGQCIIVHDGMKIDFYEVAPESAGVEVRENVQPEQFGG